jgi:hypothetical protein
VNKIFQNREKESRPKLLKVFILFDLKSKRFF